MKKYIPVPADEAPASGTAQIDAGNDDTEPVAAAKAFDRNMVTVGPDPDTSVCHRNVATPRENCSYSNIIADHLPLEEALLCHGPKSARLLCEAALGLITTLEAAMEAQFRILSTLHRDGRLPTSLESTAIEKISAAAIDGIDDFELAVRRPLP
jgi:hypothetical protein